MLKTLLFSTLYPSETKPGHGIFVENRLRQLTASGALVSRVLAPVPWFPSRNRRFGAWSEWAQTPRQEHRFGIEVSHPRYFLPPKVGMSVAPILLALGARSTFAELNEKAGGFDLIDAHYYYPDGAAAALLSRWFDIPFVVTARGSDINLLSKFAIPRRWIRWTESKAAASITVSRALAEQLVALGGDPQRLCVLPNGVDLQAFRPENRQESRSKLGLRDGTWILSVGNLLPVKGHDLAIRALNWLPEEFRLTIVGDGPERGRLGEIATECGVAERVRFAGSQPQADLKDWYSSAEVLALCSFREGWPNVLLEALACGTPVVATNVGGIPEIVRSPVAGEIIASRNPESLAQAIRRTISAAQDRASVRSYASRFDWQKTTDGQLKLFKAAARGEKIVMDFGAGFE